MPRSVFPEISTEERGPRMEEGWFKGPGGEHIKNYGQQVMSVRAFEGIVRKSTWQVADVKKTSSVSISHHPSQQRLVHREGVHHEQEEEGRACACAWFVREGAIRCSRAKVQAHGVDVINQVADGMEQRKRVLHFFDGRKGERGRQVQAS